MEKTPHSLKITMAALLAANVTFVQAPEIARAASEADPLASRIAAVRETLSTRADDREAPSLVRFLRAISNGATRDESRVANVADWDNTLPAWNDWRDWHDWNNWHDWDNRVTPWGNT